MSDETKQENFRGRIARGFAWEGLSKLGVQIISWVSTIWVARLLSPEDYGLVATSGLFTGVMSMIMEFGLGAGIVTRKEVTDKELNQCLWLSVTASLILYAILFVAAPYIADAYDLPQLTNILRVAALGLPIAAWRVVPYSLLLRNLNYRYRALIEMCGQFIQAASVVVFAMHGFGAWSLVWGYLASGVFLTVAFVATRPKFGRPTLSTEGIEGILRFGVRITGARALGFAVGNSDMAMITSLLGARAAGTYSVAFNLASAPLDKIGAIFNRVAFPAVARMSDDPGRSRRLLTQMHFALLMIASPVLIGASLTAPDLVAVLLTNKWEGAVPVLQIICLANILRLSGMMMPVILEGRGRAELVLRFQIVSALLLPLGFAVGSRWGLMGLTTTWLVVYPLIYLWLLRLALGEVDMRIRDLVGSVVPILLSNLAMAAAVLLARGLAQDLSHLSRLALSVVVGGVTYAIACYLFIPKTFWHEVRSTLAALRS